MSDSYLDQVIERFTALLKDIPPDDLAHWMNECEVCAFHSGYLNSTPRTGSPELFAQDFFADTGMRWLVRQDAEWKNAVGAEDAVELVLRLLPSDGHLE